MAPIPPAKKPTVMPTVEWTLTDPEAAKAYLTASVLPNLNEKQAAALTTLVNDPDFMKYCCKQNGIAGYTKGKIYSFDMHRLAATAASYAPEDKDKAAAVQTAGQTLEKTFTEAEPAMAVGAIPDRKLTQKNPWFGYIAPIGAGLLTLLGTSGMGPMGFLIAALAVLLVAGSGLGDMAGDFIAKHTGFGPKLEGKVVDGDPPKLAPGFDGKPPAPPTPGFEKADSIKSYKDDKGKLVNDVIEVDGQDSAGKPVTYYFKVNQNSLSITHVAVKDEKGNLQWQKVDGGTLNSVPAQTAEKAVEESGTLEKKADNKDNAQVFKDLDAEIKQVLKTGSLKGIPAFETPDGNHVKPNLPPAPPPSSPDLPPS